MKCANGYYLRRHEAEMDQVARTMQAIARRRQELLSGFLAALSEGDVLNAFAELGDQDRRIGLIVQAIQLQDAAEVGRLVMHVVHQSLRDLAQRRAEHDIQPSTHHEE